jgi:hypothetical protein
MPSFTYCGTTPKSYAEERDEEGVIIGTVSCGDEREFDAEWTPPEPAEGEEPLPEPPGWPAPDADWFPSGGPLPVRLPAEEGAEAPEPGAGKSGTEDKGASGKPAPAGGRKPSDPPAGSGGTPPATITPDGEKEAGQDG